MLGWAISDRGNYRLSEVYYYMLVGVLIEKE